MPYFGLTSISLCPHLNDSVRLTPVWVCAMLRLWCAAYSGFTVRHAPVFAYLVIFALILIVVMDLSLLNVVSQFIDRFSNKEKPGEKYISELRTKSTFLFVLIFSITTLMVGTIALGKLMASITYEYQVASTSPKCVVLFSDSERFICSSFDRNKKEFDTNYQVLYYKDNQNLSFVYESVGALHPKPTPTKTSLPTPTELPTITPTP